jgi:hypothetical protein
MLVVLEPAGRIHLTNGAKACIFNPGCEWGIAERIGPSSVAFALWTVDGTQGKCGTGCKTGFRKALDRAATAEAKWT